MASRVLPVLAAVLVLPACSRDDAPAADPIFLTGCPEQGKTRALKIDRGDQKMHGPDAAGGQGDFLLMNERAAFVVQGTERIKSYYYYGGIVIDAVSVDGCRQAGPERFGEVGLIAARGNLTRFDDTILRGFRADTVEIIKDGSGGGEARVRARGRDDYFWLLELTLLKRAFEEGKPRGLTAPYGVEITVDYVLPPGSPVLRIELAIDNRSGAQQAFQTAAAVIFGDTTEVDAYAHETTSFAGYDVKTGVPWLVSSGGDGAWAFSRHEANMGSLNIAGVEALLDADQVLLPISLAPGGRHTTTWYLAVGATDANSAVARLIDVNPVPIPDLRYGHRALAGRATELASGAAVAGARIALEMEAQDGVWRTLDVLRSGADGKFATEIPDFGQPLRLAGHAEGYADPEPLALGAEAREVAIGFGPAGRLDYEIKDGSGALIPAKILLWKHERQVHRIHGNGRKASTPVVPGAYQVTVSRGFEYEVYEGSLAVPEGGAASLSVTLERLVDTSGWLSADGHMHAGPSADSQVTVRDRVVGAAAEGLELAIATDHEIVADWRPAIEEGGVASWIATVAGQEVTAPIPEHTNMYPVDPRPDLPRGDPVRWYGMDIDQIYAAERTRGADIVQLNHPRHGCNYMCLIRYDRMTGLPALEDPTELGFEPGQKLWSWNFDAIEYQNGNSNVFVDPARPDRTGLFEDWMSFLNLGHRIAALAVTDIHGVEHAGSPRFWFRASTDSPADFAEQDLVSAVKEGRVVASTGAFARVRMNGNAELGDTVVDGDGEVDLAVRIEAIPEIDVTHFRVFVNCDEALKVDATDPDGVVKYDGTVKVPVTGDAHVVMLAFGTKHLPRAFEQFDPKGVPRATTNAIYVDADGVAGWTHPGGKTCQYTRD